MPHPGQREATTRIDGAPGLFELAWSRGLVYKGYIGGLEKWKLLVCWGFRCTGKENGNYMDYIVGVI